ENYFVKERDRGITDDHYFVNTIAKIPMIDIINIQKDSEVGFGTYWHTHNDVLDVINKRTLKAVGQLVLAVVYRENNGVF
ncbi:MAG: M28 family peptidase, partial [Bacteroidota bacterium]